MGLIIAYLTLVTALALSGIAEYYSIVGLATIFPGAFYSVIVMGSILGVSKLVTASWLYRYWHRAPVLLKTYLTTAVVILMCITSMGIFGFLSKAHIDSTLGSNMNFVELKTLTDQQDIAQKRLSYLLERAGDPSTASARIDRQIQSTQAELKSISEKRLPLLREENKLTVEVGPIKYVAEAIYGKTADGIDRAVRAVIIIIMVVFDPLAVLLLIAANMSFTLRRGKIKRKVPKTITKAKNTKPKIQNNTQQNKTIPDTVVNNTPKQETPVVTWPKRKGIVEVHSESKLLDSMIDTDEKANNHVHGVIQ